MRVVGKLNYSLPSMSSAAGLVRVRAKAWCDYEGARARLGHALQLAT